MGVPPADIAVHGPAQRPHALKVTVVEHVALQVGKEALHPVQPWRLHRQPDQVQLALASLSLHSALLHPIEAEVTQDHISILALATPQSLSVAVNKLLT